MMATAIIGGMVALGGAIFRSIKRDKEREEQIKQLEAQQQNMTAVHKYKEKMFSFQKRSLDMQLQQGQKALEFAEGETKRKQGRDLDISRAQSLATDFFNTHQMNNLAHQITDNVASARQASAVSGFRNSGSAQNLANKQASAGDDAMNSLQAQMDFSRYQASVNAQEAYANSNAQLKQYAMEKQNIKDKHALSLEQLEAERQFETEQYEAQYNSLEGAQSYLGNYGNFILDDIIDVGGTVANSALNVYGASEQQKINDDIWQRQYDYSEYSRITNANLQRELAGMNSSTFEVLPDTNMYSPNYSGPKKKKNIDNPYL